MISVLVFCILSFISMAILFGILFGRNELKSDDISLRYEEIDNIKYPRTTISFISRGNALCGYIYGEQNQKGLILFAHGIRSGADSFLPEVMYFVDKGWRVMTFDGTGTRRSEGKSILGLPQTKIDVEAAIEYIKSDNSLSTLPLVLYGHSMGGYAVAAALGNYRDDVEAVVCVAAFNSPADTMYFHSKNTVGILADIEYPFMWLYQTLLFGADANITAVDGLNSSDTPVLIAYSENDLTVPHDEIGLYAYREEIINPRVNFYSMETYYDGHTTAWLTENSGKYATEQWEMLKRLHAEYGDIIPADIYSEFLNGVNKMQMNELNLQYADMVNDFFRDSLDDTSELSNMD
ncbi:MAG: lysophospholipase [Syntrophomonadaceae bacterium]|nr:lysophospholipase [Syntrophomonadaceae bacterium]